jgi:hypothetical protein
MPQERPFEGRLHGSGNSMKEIFSTFQAKRPGFFPDRFFSTQPVR